ncbi:hypothetical protein [Cyclobacterium xiamenense]|uniref:hypothetical protein n=1 Tax=Cyclobacterium xiamenense TaxID=1297121 RepID=UPI0035CEDC43
MSTFELILSILALVVIGFLINSVRKRKQNATKVPGPKPAEKSKTTEQIVIEKIEESFPEAEPEDVRHTIVVALAVDGKPDDYDAPPTDTDNWPELLSLSYFIFDKEGYLIKDKDLIFKNSTPPPENTLEEYCISMDHLQEMAIPPNQALREFIKDAQGCKKLVAHNASYVNNVLHSNFLRNKEKYPFSRTKKVCTMKKTRQFLMIPSYYSDDYKYPKLEELAAACFSSGKDPEGFEINIAKSSYWKARATAKCFWFLHDIGEL